MPGVLCSIAGVAVRSEGSGDTEDSVSVDESGAIAKTTGSLDKPGQRGNNGQGWEGEGQRQKDNNVQRSKAKLAVAHSASQRKGKATRHMSQRAVSKTTDFTGDRLQACLNLKVHCSMAALVLSRLDNQAKQHFGTHLRSMYRG